METHQRQKCEVTQSGIYALIAHMEERLEVKIQIVVFVFYDSVLIISTNKQRKIDIGPKRLILRLKKLA